MLLTISPFITVKKIIIGLVFLVGAFGLLPACSSGQAANQSEKEANEWYEKQEWLNGLQRAPHQPLNKQEFARQYQANKAAWDKAFAYLKETDLVNLRAGKYAIDGEDVYALVSEGATKELGKTKWEGHKNYHDIHFVITGKEKIGITPVQGATILKEYDPAKDIAFYESEGKYFVSDPANFFIVLAGDAHRPGVKADGADSVKKVVIKIRKVE